MCHVLTVFSFTDSVRCIKFLGNGGLLYSQANFAYRGIARFAKRVIDETTETVASDPFPATQLPSPLSDVAVPISRVPSGLDAKENPSSKKGDHVGREKLKGQSMSEDDTIIESSPDVSVIDST